jgi:hypothetical protein
LPCGRSPSQTSAAKGREFVELAPPIFKPGNVTDYYSLITIHFSIIVMKI